VMVAFACETRVVLDPVWRPGPGVRLALGADLAAVLAVGVAGPGMHVAGWPSWQGLLPWTQAVLAMVVLLWCLIELAGAARSTSMPLQRRQLRGIIAAALLPGLGTAVVMAWPRVPLARYAVPLSVLLAGLAHYRAVARHGRLQLLPVARSLVLDHLGDAVVVMDPAGLVVDLNPAAHRLSHRLYPDLPHDLIGLPARLLLPHRDQRRALTEGICHLDRPDGPVDLDLRISPLLDDRGRLLGRVVVARDITEIGEHRRRLEDQLHVIEQLRRELEELTVRDDLTGLHNRRHLIRRIESDLDLARSQARPLSVILLDIDRFKAVNDRYGHAVGDALLVATARELAGCVRPDDTVARYGGEEFVVLLPHASLDEALHLAEALRARCATVRVDTATGPVATTVSAGVATFPDCGWTSGELLQRADEALYAAKRAGRDRVVAARSDRG